MGSQIDKLTIHGFQSIRRLDDFPLGALNVLIGANGAGKTNFINYFRMLNELVEKRLQIWVNQRGKADRLLTFGVKETSQIYSLIRFGKNGYSFTLAPTDDARFVFTDERSLYEGKPPFTYGGGHNEAFLKDDLNPNIYYHRANFCYNAISSWKIFHFHDTSNTAGVMRPQLLHVNNKSLVEDAQNLAPYLYRLRQEHPQVYQQIVRTVQLTLPFFDDFVLSPETPAHADPHIRLNWKQRNTRYEFLPSQLSDGSIRFICLVTALLQPQPPSTLIIDEPELGLHPHAIRLLGALIRSESKRMQIIISTQSVPLLNEFNIEDIIVVSRVNEVSTFERLSAGAFDQWLEDYTLGELWEKNILGGRP